jgi:hypothetical protein
MSLDCEGLGATCSFAGCGIFDFLPTTCVVCHAIYCTSHADRQSHDCCKDEERTTTIVRPPRRELLSCSTCGIASIFITVCSVCHRPTCVAHRFEHQHPSDLEIDTQPRSSAATAGVVDIEPKVRFGPLPTGARGKEMIVVMVSLLFESSPETSSLWSVQSLSWCRGVVGLGGSAGKICDDAVSTFTRGNQRRKKTRVAGTSGQAHGLSCIAVVVEKNPSEGGVLSSGGGGSPWARRLDATSLRFRVPPKHALAQDFLFDEASSNGLGPMCLIFLIVATSCVADLQALTSTQMSALLMPKILQDHELARRLYLVAALSRKRRGLAEASEGGGFHPSQEESACVTPDPSTQLPTPLTVVDDAEIPWVTSTALLDLGGMCFASTKVAPRGLSMVKSASKSFVSIIMAHRSVLKDPAALKRCGRGADGFVMAVDPNWPCGKLLDRVLEEAQALGCPKDPAAYVAMGGPCVIPPELVFQWGLVRIPSCRYVCQGNPQQLSQSCGSFVEDKGGVLLIAAPTKKSTTDESPAVVATKSLDRLITSAMTAADPKRLKLVQMKECCLM